jgi:putative FmdB family regulatory protein
MPIYDYQCKKCAHQFELLVLKSTVVQCPSCKSKRLEQLLSTGIGVSSASISASNVQAARRKYGASKNLKDKRVAEAEHIREHQNEH